MSFVVALAVAAVIPSLELLIGCLLKALDPRDSTRTQSLKEVSACLRVVLKNFPMTSYSKVCIGWTAAGPRLSLVCVLFG